MKETILKSENPMTIIAIGPLTNIAILLSTYPEVTDYIKEIVLMGGSTGRGNVTPLAEFNIYCDPEAAQVVFNSGLPLTMIGLDLAREAIFTHDYVKSFKIKMKQDKCYMIYFNTIEAKTSNMALKFMMCLLFCIYCNLKHLMSKKQMFK